MDRLLDLDNFPIPRGIYQGCTLQELWRIDPEYIVRYLRDIPSDDLTDILIDFIAEQQP